MDYETSPTRPVEDYVIARITIQERLARLTPHQRIAVVWYACGFQLYALAEIKGTAANSQNKSYRRAMKKIKPDTLEKSQECCECGATPVYLKGLCSKCYNRQAWQRRKARMAAIE